MTQNPPRLLKIMERRWAEKFIKCGAMRFGNLESYRYLENSVLGDPNEGEGTFYVSNHRCTTGSVNPNYSWCAAKLNITVNRILTLAKDGGYNCVLCIHDPCTLIRRIASQLKNECPGLELAHQSVSYNKGANIGKKALEKQKFQFNIFQKDPTFSEDCEYRIAITDCNRKFQARNHVKINIGKCSDIAIIVDLPVDKKIGFLTRVLPEMMFNRLR